MHIYTYTYTFVCVCCVRALTWVSIVRGGEAAMLSFSSVEFLIPRSLARSLALSLPPDILSFYPTDPPLSFPPALSFPPLPLLLCKSVQMANLSCSMLSRIRVYSHP